MKTNALPKTILLINGPNLNLLGLRNPQLYGSRSLDYIVESVRAHAKPEGFLIGAFQSNHEGKLIDFIQDNALIVRSATGIIINPAGLSHSSVSLRDTLEAANDIGVPSIEVHVSKINSREPFRHDSLTAGACIAQIVGKGPDGYIIALQKLLEYIRLGQNARFSPKGKRVPWKIG